MRVLFLTSTFEISKGWGRYARGFLGEAKRRAVAEAPDPKTLASRDIHPLQPLRVAMDAVRLREAAASSDIIHAVTEPMAPLAFLLGAIARKPYIVSVHGSYGDLRSYPLSVRWLYRIAFRRATSLAAVSSYTAGLLRERFPKTRIDVIPGGFSPPAPTVRAAAPDRSIFSAGELKRRKGFHALVRAIGRLKREGFPCRLRIAGTPLSTVYLAELEGIIKEEGLGEDVSILGRVSDEELGRRYDEADLFVLASEHAGRAFEGLGLVYLEALSRGIPVIGTRDSGASDVIRDGENGLLVSPGDVEGLAKAIRSVLEDAGAWRAKADALVKSVGAFRWDAVGARMMRLYEETAGNVR